MEKKTTDLKRLNYQPDIEKILSPLRPLASLKIDGIDDKKGMKAVNDAIKKVKTAKSNVEKDRKAIVSEIVAHQKFVNSTAGDLKMEIENILAPLEDERQRIENEKIEKIEQEKREKLQRFNARTDQLFGAGFTFDGVNYSVGAYQLTANDVEEMADDDFAQTVEAGKAEKERIDKMLELAKQAAKNTEPKPDPEPKNDLETPGALFGDLPFDDGSGSFGEMPAQPEPVPAHTPETYHPEGYDVGFESCRKKVLLIFEKNERIKRSELIEKIKALNP